MSTRSTTEHDLIPATQLPSGARLSGNPIFPGWYADPELHIFQNRYYIYPTTSRDFEQQTSFEVFSSDDLTNWRNEGVILSFADVPWSTNRAAWAPSCIERDGKYFFYFSAGDGAGLGVAVAEHPAGPFRDAIGKPLISEYHFGAQPIDAHAFLDDDGQAYLYYGGWKRCVVVRLEDNMTETTGEFREITPPGSAYVEGSFMLKRRGEYYFMWSEGNWGDSTYAVAYARASSPLGPFNHRAVVLKSDPQIGNGAGHHSVLQLPDSDDWLICYHRRPLGETNGHHRVTCLDRMVFNDKGDIEPVILTADGVPARPLRRQGEWATK
jgi:beta-xylosidase